MKISFHTLGCRLNQFETDSLISLFKKNGFEIVSYKDFADIYVINTCTVTSRSDYKSRNAINRANKINPNAFIIVAGCYVDTNENDIIKIPGINVMLTNQKKHGIFDIVTEYIKSKTIIIPENDTFKFPSPVLSQRTRNYLKIQDGCDQFCSYCKIPFARGSISRSRKIEDVISSFQGLISIGIKEIVLTGINLGKYETGIAFLLQKLLQIKGDYRIHLSSIELKHVDNPLIEILTEEKICSHLNIPLQSGSTRILELMNRNYSHEDYINQVEKIKNKISNINITTDIMVGFPGENNNDFEDTIKIIKEIEFGHIHTFRYSEREGTKAQKMKNTVSVKESVERSEIVRNLSDYYAVKFREKLKFSKLNVLIEKNKIIENNIYSYGKSSEYIDVLIKGKFSPAQFVNCRLISSDLVLPFAESI